MVTVMRDDGGKKMASGEGGGRETLLAPRMQTRLRNLALPASIRKEWNRVNSFSK
jgi:hypothetical protein